VALDYLGGAVDDAALINHVGVERRGASKRKTVG